MNITFRPAEITDADVILSFMQTLYEQDRVSFAPDQSLATLVRLLQDPSLGGVWLICSDAEAIGYVALTLGYSLEFRGRDAFVDELFVQQEYRERGVGTQALVFLESVCRDLGIRALHLEVEHENAKAQRFYRKVGFGDRNYYLMTKHIIQDELPS